MDTSVDLVLARGSPPASTHSDVRTTMRVRDTMPLRCTLWGEVTGRFAAPNTELGLVGHGRWREGGPGRGAGVWPIGYSR
eukprot:scaffold97375_cov70-Phaeocystis_antarctica.AAC.1